MKNPIEYKDAMVKPHGTDDPKWDRWIDEQLPLHYHRVKWGLPICDECGFKVDVLYWGMSVPGRQGPILDEEFEAFLKEVQDRYRGRDSHPCSREAG